MSKAILVMDMPKSCNECDVICTEYYLAYKNGNIENLVKPDGCPWKEIPQKYAHHNLDNTFMSGWNACIDEILKGSEKNG